MTRGVRWSFVGSLVLVTLAGCGRGILHYAQREPWRRSAEVACLQSGGVKEGPGVVRIESIEGPGMCGATFPLKVAVLGEGGPLGFTDEPMRPPGAIAGAPPAAQPRWPIATQNNYAAPPGMPGAPMSISPPGVTSPDAYPQRQPYAGAPSATPRMIWNEGPPPAQTYNQAPMSQPAYGQQPMSSAAPGEPMDDEDDMPPQTQPGAASPQAMPSQALPPLGPQRAPVMGTAPLSVELKPTATLACPIVSALDRWIAASVQPAAQHWFGKQVVEIKQISAYSCRGMNGNPNAHISEHAFGNALDIAAFVLADGHRITVEGGWHGTPEEQGFLRDVQGAACDQFTTVLAPGSNKYHYNHIHVDLMRRASGRRICQPGAVDGEVVAARARANPRYAARSFEPPPTRRYDPPIEPGSDPFAWRGDAHREDGPTGSIGARRPGIKNPAAEDLDWVEEPGPRPAIDWSADRHKVR